MRALSGIRRVVGLVTGLALVAAEATAHVVEPALRATGGPRDFHELIRAWSFEPGVTVPLVVVAALYFRGMARRGRAAPRAPLGRGEVASFAAGWLTLALALVSPLHPWGSVLFSAHMTQHELLMLVAAPLLVLGRPSVAWLRAMPPRVSGTVARWSRRGPVHALTEALANPFLAWALHAVVLWTWHAPSLFQAALRSEAVHALQHVSFLASALVFWWAVLRGRPRAAGYGAAVLAMFTTAFHSGLLGALIALADTTWYPAYHATASWGLTPLEDQQLGGLLMWVPACSLYVVAGLILFGAWMKSSGDRVRRRESEGAPVRPDPASEEWVAEGPRSRRVRPAVLAVSFGLATLVGSAIAFGTLGCARRSAPDASAWVGGDAERGRLALRRYGCNTCHTIPGVRDARALVGPPLAGIAQRSYIAGVLPNVPDNLVRWIVDPPGVDSLTAMPAVGVTERDARDIATYLYSQR